MDPSIVFTSIGTTLLTNFVSGKDSSPQQTLNDIWDMSFGSLINAIAEKKRIKHAFDVEAYKKKLEQEILSIPLENLIEPPLSIVGPVLEASKFYIGEEKLRSMFSKLVASSMDERKVDDVHPAFVEIIKQLSPLDAEIIASFIMRRRGICFTALEPIFNVGVKPRSEPIFIPQSRDIKFSSNSPEIERSITNLKRLGLVQSNYLTVPYTQVTFDFKLFFELYFCDHPYYQNFLSDYLSTEDPNFEPFVQRVYVEPSPLGMSFLRTVCGL
ncbi:DUF4393 domain-containing protein [Priestia megaterium]|uniref:DUF4393 domain-containing protein n=1 Tax=Priestia megaterium TaxID=1404 RepID=UPI0015D02C38|nr:DUF4393 domain-containing protein [Priestia megaterium]